MLYKIDLLVMKLIKSLARTKFRSKVVIFHENLKYFDVIHVTFAIINNICTYKHDAWSAKLGHYMSCVKKIITNCGALWFKIDKKMLIGFSLHQYVFHFIRF